MMIDLQKRMSVKHGKSSLSRTCWRRRKKKILFSKLYKFMSIFLWPINSLFQKYILRILMLYIIKLKKESKTKYCPSIHFLAWFSKHILFKELFIDFCNMRWKDIIKFLSPVMECIEGYVKMSQHSYFLCVYAGQFIKYLILIVIYSTYPLGWWIDC